MDQISTSYLQRMRQQALKGYMEYGHSLR